jgi:hypothetical protein
MLAAGTPTYDVASNQMTGAASLQPVGLDGQFAGLASIHTAGAPDPVVRSHG